MDDRREAATASARPRIRSERARRRALLVILALGNLAAPGAWGTDATDWPPTAGAGTDRAAIERFLLGAQIVELEELRVGITRSRRAVLDDGSRRHRAHVQTIDVVDDRHLGRPRGYRFRDSYRYNVAASIVDEMLGLGMVPVSVERRVGGRRAAVTWWVDDVMMMERDRIEGGIEPPRPGEWADQMGQAKVFSAWIANDDFNATNMLITEDWKLWLIDFTRAFRLEETTALDPQRLPMLDRRVYRALRDLDETTMRMRLGDVLYKPEIAALLKRRNALVELYAARVEELGEAAVICDRPGH